MGRMNKGEQRFMQQLATSNELGMAQIGHWLHRQDKTGGSFAFMNNGGLPKVIGLREEVVDLLNVLHGDISANNVLGSLLDPMEYSWLISSSRKLA